GVDMGVIEHHLVERPGIVQRGPDRRRERDEAADLADEAPLPALEREQQRDRPDHEIGPGDHERGTAPKRSCSRATMRCMAASASSSVSVVSSLCSTMRSASDFFPSPTCGPRYSSNTVALRTSGSGGTAAAST